MGAVCYLNVEMRIVYMIRSFFSPRYMG